MTVATSNYRNEYNGDCSTTCFAYTFRILDKAHLEVFVAGVLKTLTADYSVTGVDAAAGGNVLLKTPPVLGQLVVINRDVPLTQTTDYVEGTRFPASSHETALDKLTMALQVVKGIALRSWRFSVGSTFADDGYVVDEPKGGLFPRIKSDCSGIEYVALEACGTYANPVTTKGDLIRGNDCGAQERLGIGTRGLVLTAMPGTDKPDWAAGGAVLLRNKADTQADAGRMYALDPDCDSAFSMQTPQSGTGIQPCGRLMVVTNVLVGDDCQGMLVFTGGPVTMLAQGSIARGEYVKKGSTVGAVITTCARHEHYRPVPRGAVGIAAAHSSGGCVDIIKLPAPSNGMQGLPAVRRNRSASVAGTPCTQVDLIADALVLADSCSDVVVVRSPATLTNVITTDVTNKKNSRDQSGAFAAGDVHFYWTYEAATGTVYSRSSAKGPETSGPELPSCETHAAYSHSLYWDANCLRRHTVRGGWVHFDCTDSTRILNAGTASCETRINLPTVVPAVAQRIRFSVEIAETGNNVNGRVDLGFRLNCIAHVFANNGGPTDATTYLVELPNVNQEIFYRVSNTGGTPTVTIRVLAFSVPNGDT